MKYLDLIELNTEREEYAALGLHEGMCGVIWNETPKDNTWFVKFPFFTEGFKLINAYIDQKYFRVVPLTEMVTKKKYQKYL